MLRTKYRVFYAAVEDVINFSDWLKIRDLIVTEMRQQTFSPIKVNEIISSITG